MASKAANTAEMTENREEAAEAPLLDTVAAAIKKMVARGKERGYVTYDELNAALPPDRVSSEQIEDTMTMLSELGINLIESEESEESGAVDLEDGDGETRGNVDDDDVGRTDDPVRMYLREMGSVELLSREGEIAIAKRIEAGREMMIGGICENPLTVRALVAWREALAEGKMLLRDIIDLDATYAGGGFEAASGEPASPAIPEGAAENGEDAAGEFAEMGESEDGESEEGSISLAAMEAQLKPGILAILDEIAEIHKKLYKIEDQRVSAFHRGEGLPRQTERRYEKLKAEVVEKVKRLRLNNTRIEHLVEQLYALNRRLLAEEGKLLRLAESAGIRRPEFLQHYLGNETLPLGSIRSPPCPGGAGPRSLPSTRRKSPKYAPRSPRSPMRRSCRSPNSAASSRPSSAASARRAGPRRRWSKPICASSSRSPRNTPIAACNFLT